METTPCKVTYTGLKCMILLPKPPSANAIVSHHSTWLQTTLGSGKSYQVGFPLQKLLAFHYISGGIRLLGPFQHAFIGKGNQRLRTFLGLKQGKEGLSFSSWIYSGEGHNNWNQAVIVRCIPLLILLPTDLGVRTLTFNTLILRVTL